MVAFSMLDYLQISELIEDTANSKLGQGNVVRVMTEPGIDSEGQDALRITIVIAEGAVDRIKDDALLDNLLEIHDRLQEQAEIRTPMVGYATEQELAESGDAES
jgi:hypothetical protein